MLVLQFEGRRGAGGSDVTGPPPAPVLSNQQFPSFVVYSSHQKSTPLGSASGTLPPVRPVLLPNFVRPGCLLNPFGTLPMLFPENWLSHEVEPVRLGSAAAQWKVSSTLPSASPASVSGFARRSAPWL